MYTSDIRTIHTSFLSLILPVSVTFVSSPGPDSTYRAVLHIDVKIDPTHGGDVVFKKELSLCGSSILCSVTSLYFPSNETTNIVLLENISSDQTVTLALVPSNADLLCAVPDTLTIRPQGKVVANVVLTRPRAEIGTAVASQLFLKVGDAFLDVILDHPSLTQQQIGSYHYVLGSAALIVCRNTVSTGDVACRISPSVIQGLLPSRATGYTYSVSARSVGKNWTLTQRVQMPPAFVDEGGVCLVHGTSFVMQRSAVFSDTTDSGQVEFSVTEGKNGPCVAIGLLHMPLGGIQHDSVIVYLHVLPTYAQFDEISTVVAKLHCTWSYVC